MTSLPLAAPVPAWIQAAELLRDYRQANGRLPRQSGGDTEAERLAGNVLHGLRRLATVGLRGKKMDSAQRAWLNANVPGWLEDGSRERPMSATRDFADRAKKLGRFVNKHNRFPSARSLDLDEASLARFLDNCRQASKGKGSMKWSPSRHTTLNLSVPNWNLIASQPVETVVALVL